jgi:ketosteroid isomerase-like protein
MGHDIHPAPELGQARRLKPVRSSDAQRTVGDPPPSRDTAWAMSEENVELARKAIDALNRGDLDAWLAFLSPDVVWEALPGVPGLGELYRGRAEVRDWIEQLFELAEDGIHTEIEQLTDLGDDRVFLAIVLTARGRGSGVPFEMPNWEVIWFAEGLVTRRQIFWTRDEALEAAGLRE